jgi:PhnB protein
MSTAIEPWLTVQSGSDAERFYKTAFQATETYRMEDPDGGLILRLQVDKAGFWISGGAGSAEKGLGPDAGRMRLILIVDDPEPLFAEALRCGATEVFPVHEEYGWLLGRLMDPFGFHWEIGHPM